MILKDKNAIITGANRGIGKKTLEVFAAQGANIWACARKSNEEFEEYIAELSKTYDVIIEPIYFDLSDYTTGEFKSKISIHNLYEFCTYLKLKTKSKLIIKK